MNDCKPSEGIADREREGAGVLARLPVELEAVLEPDRTDRRLVVEAEPGSRPELPQVHAVRIGPDLSDVEEERRLEPARDRDAPLGIRDELHVAAHAHAVGVQGLPRDAEIVARKGALRGRAAREQPFRDRYDEVRSARPGRLQLRRTRLAVPDDAAANREDESRRLVRTIERRLEQSLDEIRVRRQERE